MIGRSAIARAFGYSEINKRQICNWEHDQWTAETETDTPPKRLGADFMRGVLDGTIEITQEELIERIYFGKTNGKDYRW
jgi:hypothetical protein